MQKTARYRQVLKVEKVQVRTRCFKIHDQYCLTGSDYCADSCAQRRKAAQCSNTGQATAPTREYHQVRSRIRLDAPDGSAQQGCRGTESNGYRGMGPCERVGSVNERSSHRRVVSGQLHNAQTQANRPLTHAHTTRYVFSNRMHQFDDRVVYVTGLLPEAPRRIIRVRYTAATEVLSVH
jgi:hypothetical protein